MSLGALFNTSCTKEEANDSTSVDNQSHHVGLYSFSKDLLEIYDAKVEALCKGKVVSTIDLKMIEAYSEDDETVSYNVDTYTSDPVEYRLSLSCCMKVDDLDRRHKYDLGYDIQFMSVTRSPEKALKMLEKNVDCMPQTISGRDLRGCYNEGHEFSGQTVYEVYAIVNSRSFILSK